MATTSIWSVKGYLSELVIYVENPDKTENPKAFEKVDMSKREAQGLSDVIDYAVQTKKTSVKTDDEDTPIMKNFVSGINCTPSTARDEMLAAKIRFGKDEGVAAYHGYQSFVEGEVTPEQAHEIGIKLAEKLWGEKYQVVVATHLDKGNHLHNHFVVNTVSFIDGIRYHRTKKDYYDMQTQSDKLCREYGLSVLPNPKGQKSKHYGEWKAEKEGKPTLRGMIKEDVDTAISQSMTEKQFFAVLKKMGYEIKVQKYIYLKRQGRPYFSRLERQLGEDYSIESIRKRILAQSRPEHPAPFAYKQPKRYKLKGSYNGTRKITGFRALYFHYCFKLGVFPKDRPQSKKRIHWLFREDLIKLEAISKEARLLAVNKIDTAEQLSLYQDGLKTEIKTLTEDRKKLYKKSRTVEIRSDENKLTAVKTDISQISKRLGTLRKEVGLCDGIAARSGVIKEKLKKVREDENLERKELMKNDQRRASRTNR